MGKRTRKFNEVARLAEFDRDLKRLRNLARRIFVVPNRPSSRQ